MKYKILFGLMMFLGLAWGSTAMAATLSVVADTAEVKVGDEVAFSVIVDTDGVAVNAAQISLQFPTAQLEVVGIDQSSSIFNFWVEGPSFSNETGRISFLGGSTNGFNGQSLRLLRIFAKMKTEGTADILFLDGMVSASDGSGTNILTAMKNGAITATTATPVETLPEQIIRTSTEAELVPTAPILTVPLYADPSLWYNTLLPFLVTWELPSDISAVATSLDQNPIAAPKISEGLFDNKLFTLSENGIWYLHVRFKNNQGWGVTTNYRVAVDTLPPIAYQIEVSPAVETDVPTPTITYASADQLSGLSTYTISVDGNEAVTTLETTHALPALSPGKHVLSVEAIDQAGNGTSASADLTIVPIDGPTLSIANTNIYVGEGNLYVSGNVAQGVEVLVDVRMSSGELVASTVATPDQTGTWSAHFEQPLKKGKYTLNVTARDVRGAVSLPVQAVFSVIDRPFVIIAGIMFSQSIFLLVIIILLIGGYAVGWQISKKQSEKRGWHAVIAQRDVGAAFDDIEKELAMMIDRHKKKKLVSTEAVEMLLVAKRINARIKETKQYILDHIEGINT